LRKDNCGFCQFGVLDSHLIIIVLALALQLLCAKEFHSSCKMITEKHAFSTGPGC
jgi:hypothetical protein